MAIKGILKEIDPEVGPGAEAGEVMDDLAVALQVLPDGPVKDMLDSAIAEWSQDNITVETDYNAAEQVKCIAFKLSYPYLHTHISNEALSDPNKSLALAEAKMNLEHSMDMLKLALFHCLETLID